MAKEDFCFTYYDGDAARDMAHMNRLERGAYSDIVISQRKFGALTIDQIKKILGRDFENCWPSIELVMVKTEEKYFIEWLQNSIEKSRRHSKKQSQNVKNRYKEVPKEDLVLPKEDLVTPLGDGDGNRDKKENNSFEKSEKLFLPELMNLENNYSLCSEMMGIWLEKNPTYLRRDENDFTALREISTGLAVRYELDPHAIFKDKIAKHAIKLRWGELVTFIAGHPHFKNYSLEQVAKHFQSILLSKDNGTIKNHRKSVSIEYDDI